MSHSAHVGLDRAIEAGSSLSGAHREARSRVAVSAAPFSDSTIGLVQWIGQQQPRFTLVALGNGSDEQELGALSGGIEGDDLPWVGTSPFLSPCGTARPGRLAAFSSCGSDS